jgi:hypothetical protein
MGIDARWVDESGNSLQELLDARDPSGAQGVLSNLMVEWTWPAMSSTVCLRFIDPYGDAVFNRAQLPILIDELRAVLRDEQHPRTRAHLEEVIGLAAQAAGEVHTYFEVHRGLKAGDSSAAVA